MRKLFWLLMLGCAPSPVVKLHVSPSAAQRLDPAQRTTAQAAIDTAKKALVLCEAEVTKAEGERVAPAAAESKQRTKELDAVMRAAEARHTAMVGWRRAQCEVNRWQVAAAEAQLELVTAEAVARTGADVDPARFRAQAAEMQSGRSDASRHAATARTQLEQKEKALNDAKDAYAATLKPASSNPQPSTEVAGSKPR
jgi:hypothetical protein